jgi:FKBP-type peptidyl-prolyl cis-trans isomerase (trigger factor)
MNSIDVPPSLINDEIKHMETNRQIAPQKEGETDPKVVELATRQVQMGLLVSECVKVFGVKLDKSRVEAFIDNITKAYEAPDEAKKWYYSNRAQLANIQHHVLQEQVLEVLMDKVTLKEKQVSFSDIMN